MAVSKFVVNAFMAIVATLLDRHFFVTFVPATTTIPVVVRVETRMATGADILQETMETITLQGVSACRFDRGPSVALILFRTLGRGAAVADVKTWEGGVVETVCVFLETFVLSSPPLRCQRDSSWWTCVLL